MRVFTIIRVIDQAWGQAILTEQAWLIKDFSVIRPKENIFSQEQNGQSRVPARVANQNAGFASSFARAREAGHIINMAIVQNATSLDRKDCSFYLLP